MEEWKTYKLSEIAKLSTGFPFDGSKYSKEGIRVVRGDNVTIGALRWETDKDKRWNIPFDRANEYSLQDGDIVVGMDGSRVGRNRAQVQQSDLPLLIAQRVACIRNNELSHQQFLYYQIFSNRFCDYIKSVQTGTSIPHVSLKQIGDYEVVLPSLPYQIKIANVLSALDSKIELNNRINHNLEEQAQAMYKSWFVDFEPFKDGKFIESELGMIPEGWRVLPAESICPINIGKTPPRSEHTWFSSDKQNITWVSISDMGNAGCFINSSAETLTKEAVEKFNIKVVPQGSILLSFKLTIGRVAIAGKELTSNEAIARFEASDYQRSFLFLTLKSYDYSSLGSTSSIATAVNSKIIKSMPIICPTDKIMTDFHFLTNDIFTEIQIRQEETSRLSELRDSLLPKLMSGELKINEIDC